MNILIVDDEARAIQAVQSGVNLEALGFAGVFTASNKAQAIECLNANAIDILLCDIEMPMGSGLELLEWVNENKGELCCIFMTCYAEFSYAQQAMHLGGFDYVLKPLDFGSLTGILRKARLVVIERRNQKDADSYNRKVAGRQFWKDFFVGDIAANRESIRQYWQQQHIDFPLDGLFLPLLVSVKRWTRPVSAEDRKLFLYALRNIADELFELPGTAREVVPFSKDVALVVLTLQAEAPEEALAGLLMDACHRLTGAAETYLRAVVHCTIGKAQEICRIPEQIELLQTIDFNNVVMKRDVLSLNTYQHLKQAYSNEHSRAWAQLLALREYGKVREDIRSTLAGRVASGTIDRHFLGGLARDFDYMLYDYTTKNHFFLDEMTKDDVSRKLLEVSGESVEDFEACVNYVLERLEFHGRGSAGQRSPVQRVKQYVADGIDRELPMDDIAAHAQLNPDYLNRIFKKETGVAISQYVVQQKIEKAKWLLRHTGQPIGEIAAAVGYYNYSSFNRNFGKITGMSPQEYKKSVD